jgi:hypothetical protein
MKFVMSLQTALLTLWSKSFTGPVVLISGWSENGAISLRGGTVLPIGNWPGQRGALSAREDIRSISQTPVIPYDVDQVFIGSTGTGLPERTRVHLGTGSASDP